MLTEKNGEFTFREFAPRTFVIGRKGAIGGRTIVVRAMPKDAPPPEASYRDLLTEESLSPKSKKNSA